MSIMKIWSTLSVVFLLAGFWAWFALGARVPVVMAAKSDLTEEEREEIQEKIDELTKKLSEVQKEKTTLSSTIRLLDNKILLNAEQVRQTELEIRVTESQVEDLSERVEGLKESLGDLSTALIHRVQQQYKQRTHDSMSRLFSTAGVADLLQQDKYLAKARAHTQELILSTEEKRQNYDNERVEKEDKQVELEALKLRLQDQKTELDQQKEDKRLVLQTTQNNERIYQEQLAAAQAEAAGLLSIKAGLGQEEKVRKVKKGDKIATIISGKSACSSGTHLHFEVVKKGNYQNPFGYLGSASIVNLSSDPAKPTGDWPWPINNAARITQGYGMTWYARVLRAYGGSPHTGVDMISKTPSDLTVRAVEDGTLYRGSVRCGSQYMRYVRVLSEDDDELSSIYVHVNY